jgi:hypothetical protein
MQAYLISENNYNNNTVEYATPIEKEINIEINTATETNLKIQRYLIEIGFEINFINKIIYFFQVNSIETAIDYITKVDGKWNHPFVNVEDSIKKICLVCGDNGEDHRINFLGESITFNQIPQKNDNINFTSIKSQQISNNIIQLGSPDKEEIILKQKNEICRICLSLITDEFVYNCNHRFCKDCILDHVLNKINSSEVEEIYCPEGKNVCSNILDDNLIRSLITGRDLERYEKFSQRSKILKIANSILCPIPDCDSYCIVDKNKIGKNFCCCIKNNHMFCHKCSQQAHTGVPCDYKLESEFKQWVGKEAVKRCPKCSFFIQKNEGCNHMTCGNSICKFEFCWICMGQYNSSHYSNILKPCYGLQYTSQRNIIVKFPCLRYLVKIGVILASLILLVLGLTLASAILIFAFFSAYSGFEIFTRDRYGNTRYYFNILTVLFMIFASIAMIPLGYMIMAVFFGTLPITLIVLLIKYILK